MRLPARAHTAREASRSARFGARGRVNVTALENKVMITKNFTIDTSITSRGTSQLAT